MASRNQRKKRANKKNNTAARSEHARSSQPSRRQHRSAARHAPRFSTETKSALRTSELAAYVVTVLAIIMTALAVDAEGDGGTDPFGAESALRYITYLTIGYMIARGLAKAGSWNTAERGTLDEQDDERELATDDQESDHAATERVGADTEQTVRDSPRPTHDADVADEPGDVKSDAVGTADAASSPDKSGPDDATPETRDRAVQH